jgi:hypothetical protein
MSLFVAAVVGCTVARADDGRFQDYAVGGRAMGLGGAFTALSDDASGIFYNPAGTVDVRRTRLSISTSLYGLEFNGRSLSDPSVLIRRFEKGFSATDFIIVPSSTGVVMGLGPALPGGMHRHALSFGTLVPRYSSSYLETKDIDPASGIQTRQVSTLLDRTLLAGVGYAFRAGPWLRVGASAQYTLRTLVAEEELVAFDEDDGSRFLVADTTLRKADHGARAVVGVKLRPGPRWAFGFSLATPSLDLWESVRFVSTETVSDPRAGVEPSFDSVDYERSGLTIASHLPLTLRAGVAFVEPASYTIALDVIAYAPSNYWLVPPDVIDEVGPRIERVPLPYEISRGPMANVALGVEKLLTDQLSVAFGGFTNFSAAPKLDVDRDGFLQQGSTRLSNVQMLGGSFALGFHGKHSLSRLGVTGSAGFGKVVTPALTDAFADRTPKLVARDGVQAFVYVFWSSSFRYGDTPSARGFDL